MGAVANASAALDVYPGWICRFYVLYGAPAIDRLREFPNTEVIPMLDEPEYGKMLWRTLAASDPDVDAVIFRDCDSRLEWRERGAVDEWIKSGKSTHSMRDIDSHQRLLLLGGMWGIRGGVIKDMHALVREWISKNDMSRHVGDQEFLAEIVWPLVCGDVMCHGLPFLGDGKCPDPHPFPPHKRCRGEYVAVCIHPDGTEREICMKNAPLKVKR